MFIVLIAFSLNMVSATNQTDIEKSLNDDLIGSSNHTTVKSSKTIEITQDNYENHFDFRTGKILSSSTISSGDTLKIGNISNRAFVIDRPLTITPISANDKISNGFIHLIKGSDGSSVLNLTINNTKSTLTLGGVTVGQLHGIWISNSNDNYIAYNTIRIANSGGVYAMPMGWSSNNRILYNDLKTYVSSVIIMGQCHYNLISHNSLEVLSYSDVSVTNLIYFNPFGHADYSGSSLCKGNIISYNYLKGFCSMPMSIILQMTYESHDGTVVANNTIFKGSFGVNLMGSNITVYGNTVNNSATGIAVSGENFTVYNNQITGDSQSIGLSAFSMNNKTGEVFKNNISFTDISVGIQIADNVYAHDNKINIAGYGIGMYLSGNNATAYKNTIKNNHDAGISIMGSFNNVDYNIVTTNNIGIAIPAQSSGLRYYSNKITQNRIISDSYGISITGLVYNTTMLDNIIETNASVGIFKQITDEISNTEEDNIVNGVILNSTAIVINDDNFNKYFTSEGYLKYELGVNRNKVIILTFLSNKNLIFTDKISVISNKMNNLLYNVTITLTQDADDSLVEGFTFINQAKEAIIVDGVNGAVINRNNITNVFKTSSLSNSAILIQGVCKNATISANNIYVNSKINYTYAINAPAISPQTGQINKKLSSGFTIKDNNIIMISKGVCEAIYTDCLNSSSFISNRINIISNDYAYGIALANVIGKLSNISISLNEIIIYSDKMAYLIELHMVDNSNISNNSLYSQSNGVYGIATYDSYNISIANNTLNIFGGDLSNIKSVSDVLGIGNAAIAIIKNGDNTTIYNNLIYTNASSPILLVNISDVLDDFNAYVVDDNNYEVFFNKSTGKLNFNIKNKLLLNLSKNQLVNIDKTLIISSYKDIPSTVRLIITKEGNSSLICNMSLVNSTVELNDTFNVLISNLTFENSVVNIYGGGNNVISDCEFSSILDGCQIGLNETSLNVIKNSSFNANSKNARVIVIDSSKDNVISNNSFRSFFGNVDYIYSTKSRDNVTNNLFEGIGGKIHAYYGIASYGCMILENKIFINGSGGLNNQSAVYLVDNALGNVISQNYIVSRSKSADEYAVVVLSDVACKITRNYLISANESKIADSAVYAISSEVHSNTPSDVYVSKVNGSDITGDGSISKPYASISNAIMNALNHSTIHIADGTYTESNILIDKDIILKSINSGKVFLNANSKQLFNITKNGILYISGIAISDAFNVDGGSVFINNGILTIEDCVIANSSSYFDNSYPNFVDITYDGNGEIDEAYTVDCSHTGMGGAILNNGVLNINSSVFYNNLGHCGGVIADFGKTSILSSLFYNNLGVHGGVIYTNSKNKMEIKNTVFKNNTALTTLDYCAIRLYTTAWSINEGNIHNMKSVCSDVIGAGGAIYTNTYIDVENSQFMDNSARTGGAIYSKSSSSSLEIKNSTFTNNRANDTRRSLGNISLNAFDFTAESNGGAIFGDYDKLYITSSGFYKNQANKNGGAVKATANDGKISDSIFDSNIAGIGGGALDISKNFIIMRTVISNNSAIYGGGVSYTSYTYYGHIQNNLNIYNSTISYNRALSDGGAFTISSGNVVVHDSNIVGNTAPSGSTISTSSSSYSIDMRYNYWGRTSGPDDSVWSVNNNNFKPWIRQWIDWNSKSTNPIIGPVNPQDDDGTGNNPKPNPGGGHNSNPSSTGSNTHTGSSIGQNGQGNGNWKYSGDGDGTNSGYGGIGNGHGGYYSVGGSGLYGGQNIKGNSNSNIPSFGESQSDDVNHQNSQSRTNSSKFDSNLATTGSVSNAMSASSASEGGADGGSSSGGESVSKAYEISQKIDELLDDGYSTLISVIFAIIVIFLLIIGYMRNKKEYY